MDKIEPITVGLLYNDDDYVDGKHGDDLAAMINLLAAKINEIIGELNK